MQIYAIKYSIFADSQIAEMKKREGSSGQSQDSPEVSKNGQREPRKKEVRTRSRYKLDYPPRNIDENDSGTEKRGKVKNEVKIDKRYLVEEKSDKANLEMKKNEEQVVVSNVMDAPLAKREVPLKMTKNDSQQNRNTMTLLSAAEKEAIDLIEDMGTAYLQDVKAYYNKKLAYHKVKLLGSITEKLVNTITKRKFIENDGLNSLVKWLLPIYDRSSRQMQPSLAVKMGVLRIVKQLALSTDQIKCYGLSLHQMINKNMKMTKIPELKELCSSIMKAWDYTMYKGSSVK